MPARLPEIRRAAGVSYRESGRPGSPALVLLHGIGSTSAGWRDQYGPLGERSARFAAIDACGHLPHLEKPERFNQLADDFLRAK